MHEETTVALDGFEHLVVREGDHVLLLVDRVVTPSGHWVLTVSNGDDEELLQMHSVDGPEGPRSPVQELPVIVGHPGGSAVLEITADRIRCWAGIAVDPHRHP